jgi:D-beta-D-heptose 7-phosphate kinase/D-beta-D-heptose 1-phosphate adenosyltransferase
MTPEQIKKIQAVNVVVLGDLMLDRYIIGDVRRISPEAPVPIIEVREETMRLGGAGNVARNIRALGANVRVLSCIGQDPDGDLLLSMLNELGADTRFLRQDERIKTITKTRVVSKNQQFLRYDREKAEDISEDYVNYIGCSLDAVFDYANIVILSDYGKGAVSPPLARLIIDNAGKRNIPVLVDPKGANYQKYTGATICTPNLNELSAAAHVVLTQEDEEGVQAAGVSLCKKYEFKWLIATRSEKGMSLISRHGLKQDFPAVAKEIVDVSGAGDTVIAIIALGMAAGFSLADCCRLANTAASIVISKFGTAAVTFSELVGSEIYASAGKLLTWEQIPYLMDYLREQNKKVVFTNGCFDIIHAGHISSFRQARKFGDVLIVGLNSDDSVRRLKGDCRPIVKEKDRAGLLEALTLVDYIVIFNEDTPESLIREICPDVLVKGKDWAGQRIAGQDFVEEHGGRVEFINMEEGLSTTNIINRIRTVYGRPEQTMEEVWTKSSL